MYVKTLTHQSWYEDYKNKIDKKRKTTHKKVPDTYKETVKLLMSINNSTGQKLFIGQKLDSISKSDLMNFIRIRRRQGSSDASIRRALACISSIFSYAILQEMCDAKPPISLIQKTLKKPVPIERYLSEEEYDKLILHSSKHLKGIIIFAVETGMRLEEFLSLRWEDVDLVNCRIIVRNTKNGKDRNLPISELAKKQLHEQLQNNNNKSVYVFSKENGERFGHIKTAFNNACRRAEIKNLRIHDLRKTFGSWRLQGIRGAKLSLDEVSRLLGHSSLDLTRSTYAFLDELKIKL